MINTPTVVPSRISRDVLALWACAITLSVCVRVPGLGTLAIVPFGLIAALYLILGSYRLPRELLLLVAISGSSLLISTAMLVESDVSFVSLASSNAFRLPCCAFAIYFLTRVIGLSFRFVSAFIAIGIFVLWTLSFSGSTIEEYWKFVAGVPVMFLALLFFGRRFPRRKFALLVALSILCAVSAILASRSYALFAILTTVIVIGASARGPRRSEASVVRVVALVLVVGLVSIYLLPGVALSGKLGSEIEASYRNDFLSSSDGLLGGRTQLPVSVAAIADSPVLGQSQVPMWNAELAERAVGISSSLGISVTPATLRTWVDPNSGRITPHSVVMQGWVVDGIMGLALAGFVVYLLVRGLYSFVVRGWSLDVGVVFLVLVSLWDMMFSPMLTGRDVFIGAVVIALIISREDSVNQSRVRMST
nr:hypothetical protein [Rhodococcus sp. 06-418-1B]